MHLSPRLAAAAAGAAAAQKSQLHHLKHFNKNFYTASDTAAVQLLVKKK